jgi:hypothetical protein
MKNKASWQTWLIASMGAVLIGCVVYIFSSDGESGSRVSTLSGSDNRGVAAVDGEVRRSETSAEPSNKEQERVDAAEIPAVAPDPQGSLLAPVRAADGYTLDAVSGEVTTMGGTQKLIGSEGLFDRVMIGESETVGIRVELPRLKVGREVVVSASNGGRLERLNGSLRFLPTAESESLELKLTPTTGRGVYNIDIRQDGAVASLRFWAGAPRTVGEPGPNFTPLPPQPETIP